MYPWLIRIHDQVKMLCPWLFINYLQAKKQKQKINQKKKNPTSTHLVAFKVNSVT